MNNLWQRYTNVLHAKGIRPPCDRWYVIRAEEFLKNHQGKRLKEYTCNLVEAYLSDLGRNNSLNTWQFQQAVDAVRILCLDVLDRHWAATFDWEYWNSAAQPLERTHPTIARELPLDPPCSDDTYQSTCTPYPMPERPKGSRRNS